ncbi:hypothetical protein HMF8227_02426 [Saliniradius amylolyticus]|uniref:DUF4426 domain-containing protein n=1 Tax=Saliniradius amylolyticus TaxID=2183582 RepID=A0A2S2E5D9_9ALTE|nr:DUF4426 domain-containing protein [Saliniradius amylolyticus]AWL12878.1 hypothetical protein HMF8227_02426 [Saliniradius amylolyticus]
MRILGLLMAVLLLASPLVNAEQMKQLGPWDVHYMAVNTSFLTPEVARSYDIQRSNYKSLINISVLDSETQEPQSVSVTGHAKNLIGTVKELDFKKVTEGQAIYYLAVLSFRDAEKYTFNIDIQHGNEQQKLTFSQKFTSEE